MNRIATMALNEIQTPRAVPERALESGGEWCPPPPKHNRRLDCNDNIDFVLK